MNLLQEAFNNRKKFRFTHPFKFEYASVQELTYFLEDYIKYRDGYTPDRKLVYDYVIDRLIDYTKNGNKPSRVVHNDYEQSKYDLFKLIKA